MIRFIIFIIFCCLVAALCSCSKVADCSYLNTDRIQQMFRVSKWHDLNWKFRDSSMQEVAWNPELLKYRDTTIFPITCPLSGIEIRYYKIQ